MKIKNKKNYLLGILLWSFLIIWIINKVIWIEIDPSKIEINPHIISLHSLFLGKNDTNYAQIKVNTWNLNILSWLVIWSGNEINTNSAWIGGWLWNKIMINWENWAIWGWSGNIIDWNFWIIGWWNNNKIMQPWWIILWWSGNTSNGGIILWWSGNIAWKDSLVLWSNSLWEEYSFAWNWTAQNNSARINATSWMLIWTLSPIDGVSLTVSWAIKLWNESNNITWSIFSDSEWCIKFYDWNNESTLGNACWINSWCQFGTIILHNWDIVEGYTDYYSTNCINKKQKVECKDWKFYKSPTYNTVVSKLYPYCYS